MNYKGHICKNSLDNIVAIETPQLFSLDKPVFLTKNLVGKTYINYQPDCC